MPEYGVCNSRVISVSWTPCIGRIPNRRSTATLAWPAPTRTTSSTTGPARTAAVAFKRE